MPHPYTESELDGGTWTEHTGPCKACDPVDPENMTPEEMRVRSQCSYCIGSGEVKSRILDPNGLVFECPQCGVDTGKITRKIKADRHGAPVIELMCRNCLVKEHAESCKNCTAGWLEGA